MNKHTSNARTRPRAERRHAVLTLVALIALVAAQLLHGGFTAAAHARSAAPDFAAIDRYLEAEMQATRLPGLALGIVQGDRIVHLKGFGRADRSGRPVMPQTPFTIGSTTKSFTALATMQLVEAGKIDLDMPVQRYLPWFRVSDEAASGHITVRHLLHQTSGLPTRETAAQLAGRDNTPGALERYVRGLRGVQLTAPVGSTFQYSNSNFNILGLIVQTVSGQSYEQYMHEHIFAPLEMRSSFTSPEEARAHGRATGHRYWFGWPVPYEMPYNRGQLPAGFIHASAEDLTHYLIAHLNGGAYGAGSILSPAGMAELHRAAVPIGDRDTEASYAMGWFVEERDGVSIVSHAGTTANFHANLVLIPDRGWGIALLMNGENGLQGTRIAALADGVTSLLLGSEPAIRPSPDSRSTFLLYTLIVLAAQLLAFANAIRLLRRWHRQPSSRPRGWLRPALRVVPPLLLSALWSAICLMLLPFVLGAPLTIVPLFVPDLGYTLLLSLGLALVWGVLKPILVVLVLRTRRGPLPAAAADAALPANA